MQNLTHPAPSPFLASRLLAARTAKQMCLCHCQCTCVGFGFAQLE